MGTLTPAPTRTWTPLPTMTATPNAKDQAWLEALAKIWIGSRNSCDSCVSPDGKWYISGTEPLKIIQIEHPELVLESQLPRGEYAVVDFFSWSPDGKIMTFRKQGIRTSCDDNKIFFYFIGDDNQLTQKEFTLSEDLFVHCPKITWSPDGQMMAIADIEENKILIMNRDLNILFEIPDISLNLPFHWTDTGLFLGPTIIDPNTLKEQTEIRLYHIQMGQPLSYQGILRVPINKYVIDISPDDRFVLVVTYKQDIRFLQVIEVDKNNLRGKVVEEFEVPDPIRKINRSVSGGTVMLQGFHTPSLITSRFDWDTFQLEELDSIQGYILYGWKTNLNGFLFYTMDDQLQIVR